MSTIPTPSSPSLSLQDPTMQTPHSTLSLEVDPCQEDSKKDKDQDQEPSHIPQDFMPPSQEPHSPSSPISYPSKYDEDTTSTIPVELTENHEKIATPMLSRETCQDQSIPSCSNSPYPLQNFVQASNALIKAIASIKTTHKSIDGLGHVAHSKDVDIPIQYPFASPKSILGPYPSKLKPSNLPSILGPYTPPSPTTTPILPYTYPIIPQDQH